MAREKDEDAGTNFRFTAGGIEPTHSFQIILTITSGAVRSLTKTRISNAFLRFFEKEIFDA